MELLLLLLIIISSCELDLVQRDLQISHFIIWPDNIVHHISLSLAKMWLWSSYLTCLCLKFLIRKLGSINSKQLVICVKLTPHLRMLVQTRLTSRLRPSPGIQFTCFLYYIEDILWIWCLHLLFHYFNDEYFLMEVSDNKLNILNATVVYFLELSFQFFRYQFFSFHMFIKLYIQKLHSDFKMITKGSVFSFLPSFSLFLYISVHRVPI